MDIQLPDIDGIEALRRIRAERALDAIPVIAVSASVMPDDQQKIVTSGFDAFVTKPINLKQFLETVKRFLAQGRARAMTIAAPAHTRAPPSLRLVAGALAARAGVVARGSGAARIAARRPAVVLPAPTPRRVPIRPRPAFARACARPATSRAKTSSSSAATPTATPDRLAAMAEELVRLKVDVILAGGQPPREAARKATTTIPIVTLSGSDPVREGWAKSLARPGGNVTGSRSPSPSSVRSGSSC